MWPVLVQCKLVRKVQEVVSVLSLEYSLQYEVMKEAVFRAYELVPEAYRQKFRSHRKSVGQTFVEFYVKKAISSINGVQLMVSGMPLSRSASLFF